MKEKKNLPVSPAAAALKGGHKRRISWRDRKTLTNEDIHVAETEYHKLWLYGILDTAPSESAALKHAEWLRKGLEAMASESLWAEVMETSTTINIPLIVPLLGNGRRFETALTLSNMDNSWFKLIYI